MPKIVITSRKPVLTAERGRLPHGIPFEVSDLLAQHLIEQGVAVLMETKEKQDRPTAADGATAPSSASLPGRALPRETLSESDNGDSAFGLPTPAAIPEMPAPRKRGRPRKEAAA